MGRAPQRPAVRGSQAWLQRLVEQRPAALDAAIGLGPLDWLSPLAGDGYAEYSDCAFLGRVSLELPSVKLSSFWPSGGPVWDGIARSSEGVSVLIEAKAHPHELRTTS